MKYNILIPDLLRETRLEQKILGKKYNIILSNPKEFETLSDKFFRSIDGIMTGHHVSFTKKIISKLKRCKIIVRYGVGYDSIDINEASKRKIKVFNVPDYGVDEVSDHALGLILDLSRFLSGNDFFLKKQIQENNIKWKYDLNKQQVRLKNLNLGIIGLGRIGSALSLKCKHIFNNISFYDPYINDGIEKSLGLLKKDSLSDLFNSSDIISVHVPSSKKNKFFLKEFLFKNLKKRIIFINTARGDLVKSNILFKYFKKGKIASIGLDVFENEPLSKNDKLTRLWLEKKNYGKIIFTPHNAFYSKEALFEIRYKALISLKNYFEKKTEKNCVNLSLIKR